MSNVVGKSQGVVLSLQAFREGERRPAMLHMESAVPTEAYEDAVSSQLERLAQAPGLTGLTRWTGSTPDFESISSSHSVTPAFAEQSYDFDSRHHAAAKATLGEGLIEFRDFTKRFELLLIHHAAHMVGFVGTDPEIYAAQQRGELAPASFRTDITTSPVQDELLAGLLAFQVGLESSHPVIVRDSIIWGAKTVANLSYMADHPDVAEGAQAIIKSANDFPFTYEKQADCNSVAIAMCDMATAVPGLANSINFSAFQLGAGRMAAIL